MAEGLVWLVCFIVGHVFGSIPCGLWLVKAAHGIDIREYGSKNIGTTNVFRTVGGKTAFFVLLCDMMKGILAVALVAYFTNNAMGGMVAAGIGALLGHNYSIFLGFKGGRGVATGLGLIPYFMPKVCIASFGVWLILVLLTRYVSLGSVVAAICTPIFAYYFGYSQPLVIFAVVAGGFVVIRHAENIKRLLNGTESKIKQGNAKDLQKK